MTEVPIIKKPWRVKEIRFYASLIMKISNFLLAVTTNIYIAIANVLKSDLHVPKKKIIICFNDSPSKVMKNTFFISS